MLSINRMTCRNEKRWKKTWMEKQRKKERKKERNKERKQASKKDRKKDRKTGKTGRRKGRDTSVRTRCFNCDQCWDSSALESITRTTSMHKLSTCPQSGYVSIFCALQIQWLPTKVNHVPQNLEGTLVFWYTHKHTSLWLAVDFLWIK